MTYPLGRAFTIKKESESVPGTYTTIANARSHSATMNNEAIDVTDKDGTGWRKQIKGGIRSMDLSLSGIFTDDATVQDMLARAYNGDIRNFQVVDGLGNVFQGPFHVQSMDHSGEFNKEQVYTFKLMSADEIAFTPA